MKQKGLGAGSWGLGKALVLILSSLQLLALARAASHASPNSHPPTPNPYDAAMLRVRALSDSANARLVAFGKSGEGRAIPAFVISDLSIGSEGKTRVMIVAGQHGDEGNPVESVLSLCGKLASGSEPELLKKCVFIVVPVANPDGFAEKQRLNAQGIDINRDWATLKAPEAVFVDRTIRTWRPHVLIDAHEWTGPTNTAGNEIEVAPTISDSRAHAMMLLAKKVESRSGLLAHKCRPDGNPRLFHRRYTTLGHAAFLLETPCNVPYTSKDRAYEAAILSISQAVSSDDSQCALLSPGVTKFCPSYVAAYLAPLPDADDGFSSNLAFAAILLAGYLLIVTVMRPFARASNQDSSRRFRGQPVEPELETDPIHRRHALPPLTARSWVSRRTRARYAATRG